MPPMNDVTFRDIQKGLRELGLGHDSRVLAHVSLSAFGHVRGGAEAMAGALTSTCGLVLMPAFTHQCQVYPLVGPPDNGMTYDDAHADNAEAELFMPDLPPHADMGVTAETLRRLPGARRSSHPLLSFTAVGPEAETVLRAQTLAEPFGVIARLAELGGDVLLAGVDHTKNAALHYAEARAGRKQFVRWALTPEGIVACPAWPGCSDGFNALAPRIAGLARTARVGAALLQRFPLADLIPAVVALLAEDPAALLCDRPGCERCETVRRVAA